jgi:hypothetical protein
MQKVRAMSLLEGIFQTSPNPTWTPKSMFFGPFGHQMVFITHISTTPASLPPYVSSTPKVVITQNPLLYRSIATKHVSPSPHTLKADYVEIFSQQLPAPLITAKELVVLEENEKKRKETTKKTKAAADLASAAKRVKKMGD